MPGLIANDHHDTRTCEGIASPHRRFFTRRPEEQLSSSRRRFNMFKTSAVDAYSGVVGAFIDCVGCCTGEKEYEEENGAFSQSGVMAEAVQVADLCRTLAPIPPPSFSTACTLHASDSGLKDAEMEVDIVDAYFENRPIQMNVSLLDSITLEVPGCVPRVFNDPYAPQAVSENVFTSVDVAFTIFGSATTDKDTTLDGKPTSNAFSIELSTIEDHSIHIPKKVAESDEIRLSSLTSGDEEEVSVNQQADLSIMGHDLQPVSLFDSEEELGCVGTTECTTRDLVAPEPTSNWNELPFFVHPQDIVLIEEPKIIQEGRSESASLDASFAQDSLVSLSSMVTSSSSFCCAGLDMSDAGYLTSGSDNDNQEDKEEAPENTWLLGESHFDGLPTSTSGHVTQSHSLAPPDEKPAPLSSNRQLTRFEYSTNVRLDQIVEESEDEQGQFVDSVVSYAVEAEDSIASSGSMVSSSSSFCCAGLDMAYANSTTIEDGNNEDGKDAEDMHPLDDTITEPSITHDSATQLMVSAPPMLEDAKVFYGGGDVRSDHGNPEDLRASLTDSGEPAPNCPVNHEPPILVASSDDKTTCSEAIRLHEETTPVCNSRELARFHYPEGNRLSKILEDSEDLQFNGAIQSRATETCDIPLQSLDEPGHPAFVTPEAPEVIVVTSRSGQFASSESRALSSRAEFQSQEPGPLYQPSDMVVPASKRAHPAVRQAAGPSHAARRANRKAVSASSRSASNTASLARNSTSVAGDEIASTRPPPAVKIVSILKKSHISEPTPKEKKRKDRTRTIADSIHQPTLDVPKRNSTEREGVAQTASVTRLVPAIVVISPDGHAVHLGEGALPTRDGPPVISYDDSGRMRGSCVEDTTIGGVRGPVRAHQDLGISGNDTSRERRSPRSQSCATSPRRIPTPVLSRDNAAIQRDTRSQSISSTKNHSKPSNSQQIFRARKSRTSLVSAIPPPSASARLPPPDPTRLMQLFMTGEDNASLGEFEISPKCGSATIEWVHSHRSIHSVPEEQEQEQEDAMGSGSSSADSTPPVTPVTGTFPLPDILFSPFADSKPIVPSVLGSRIRVVRGSRRSDVGDGRPF